MAYTNITDIRAMSNLTTDDISDADLTTLLGKAVAEVNSRINVKVIREEIEYIDEVRENDIDGSNTTFYVKNWKGKYLADLNNDGTVDTSDITVYKVDSDNNETTVTVSSITHDEGKFVLYSAPVGTDELFVTYSYSSFDGDTPDILINLAATYLTIAYAYLKIDAGVATSVKFGNTRISRNISNSYGIYYERYKMILKEINSKASTGGYYADAKVRI